MPVQSEDLHGNVPDEAKVVLLLIDVINDLEFEGGEDLLVHALPAAEKIAELKRRAVEMGIPVIYVNDNFGKWRSDFKRLVKHCMEDNVRGRPIARLLEPKEDDYFVLKPKYSGFFSTTLDILLKYLRAKTLIITGFTADICVLFTANDAYLREFRIIVPPDCIASLHPQEKRYALELMSRILKADTRLSSELNIHELCA